MWSCGQLPERDDCFGICKGRRHCHPPRGPPERWSYRIVLAEGIDFFRVKRDFAADLDAESTLVISQFAPTQTWQAHAAMARNSIIFGLSRALVVIEAGERGGTLAAGHGALKMGRPVLVVDFGNDTPAGNRILLDAGAEPVRNAVDLKERLGNLVGETSTRSGSTLF